MATTSIKQLAISYSQRIEKALVSDNFRKNQKVNNKSFVNSAVYNELNKIRTEINNLTYSNNDQPISAETKREILDQIFTELNKKQTFPIYDSINESVSIEGLEPRFESASNDHLTDLGDAIEYILRGND